MAQRISSSPTAGRHARAGGIAALLAGAAMLLGCAGTPSASGSSSTAAAGRPVAASAAGAGGATAVASTGVAANPDAVRGAPEANPFPGTYRKEGRNGQVLYCREEPVAGTRIPKLVCATEAVMREQAADSRRVVEGIRESAGITGGCVPNTGSGC
jgi:hypothetical protein